MPTSPRNPSAPTLPSVDLSKLRDAGYVAVGAGILAFQRLQVRRREVAARLAGVPGVPALEARLAALDDRLAVLEAAYDARVESLLAQLDGKLPQPAGVALGQAHAIAKVARTQVRGLLRGSA